MHVHHIIIIIIIMQMKERLDAIEDLLSGLVKQQQKTATSSSSVAEKNPES